MIWMIMMAEEILIYGPDGKPTRSQRQKQEAHELKLKRVLWLRQMVVKCPHCGRVGNVRANIWNITVSCSYTSCEQPFELDRTMCPVMEPDTLKPINNYPEDLSGVIIT